MTGYLAVTAIGSCIVCLLTAAFTRQTYSWRRKFSLLGSVAVGWAALSLLLSGAAANSVTRNVWQFIGVLAVVLGTITIADAAATGLSSRGYSRLAALAAAGSIGVILSPLQPWIQLAVSCVGFGVCP